jgi:hypothetical protein
MSFAAFLLFAVQASAPSDLNEANRAGASAALSRAHLAVDLIGHCTETWGHGRAWEGRYQALFSLVSEASDEAEELYPGMDVISDTLSSCAGTRPPRCSVRMLQSSESQARRAVTEAKVLMSIDAAPRAEGLWFGNLRLCRERVASIEAGRDPVSERPAIVIRVADAFTRRLEALTQAHFGKRLSLVVDGRIVSRPYIWEAIREGSFRVDIPEEVTSEGLVQAAAAPC